MRARRMGATTCLWALAACTGTVGEPGGGPSPAQPVPDPRTPGQGLPAFAPAQSGLRRLTEIQYLNSVEDLLGVTLSSPDFIEPDPVSDDGFAFTDTLVMEDTTSVLAVEKYDSASRELAATVFTDPARRTALVGCEPSSATDPCVGIFFEEFLRRAFRRPQDSATVDRYRGIANVGEMELGSVWLGLQYAVATALESPLFLYRAELGQDGVYDDYEMASRMSYLLWDTTPDDTLLDAANRGELTTEEGLRREVRRLLASPRAEPAVLRFFEEWLGLEGLDHLAKNTDVFPNYRDSLGPAMRTEIERLFTPSSSKRTGTSGSSSTRSAPSSTASSRSFTGSPTRGPGAPPVTRRSSRWRCFRPSAGAFSRSEAS